MNDSLDFFKMRRCVDDLHPDPAFPGCIYSEMKMCLAPCFKGCSDEEYAGEVKRVQNYFDSGGDSLLREFRGSREAASVNLEFEDAAAHSCARRKAETLSSANFRRSPAVSTPFGVDDPTQSRPGSSSFLSGRAGRISDPIHSSSRRRSTRSRNRWKRESQECAASAPATETKSAIELMEHVAVLKRWFYRGSRTGEIFFADAKGELPMRRIVRGISRVFRGEKPERHELSTSADWIFCPSPHRFAHRRYALNKAGGFTPEPRQGRAIDGPCNPP